MSVDINVDNDNQYGRSRSSFTSPLTVPIATATRTNRTIIQFETAGIDRVSSECQVISNTAASRSRYLVSTTSNSSNLLRYVWNTESELN